MANNNELDVEHLYGNDDAQIKRKYNDSKTQSKPLNKSGNSKPSVNRKYNDSKSPVWRTCHGSKNESAGGRQVNVKVDADLDRRIDTAKKHYGCTVTMIVTTALIHFLDKYGTEFNG